MLTTALYFPINLKCSNACIFLLVSYNMIIKKTRYVLIKKIYKAGNTFPFAAYYEVYKDFGGNYSE